MHITFEGRPKQYELFQLIIGSAQGILPYKFIHSGGAIRGAKSFTNALALLVLCKQYPNSKWSIHRKDLTVLESTTVETFGKIIQGQKNWKWNRSASNYHLTYLPTQSRIFFVGANEARDRDFTDTLGLEINGAFFDQIEDVSREYYDAVCLRLGSWHIENEPRPLLLSTVNPTQTWVKKDIYERFVDGKLNPNELFFPLSPYDEPSNTNDQWEIWNSMPAEMRARMIDSDWRDMTGGKYYPEFGEHCLIEDSEPDRSFPLIISFDFNYDPCSLVIGQDIAKKGGGLHLFKEIQVQGGTLPLVNELKRYLNHINWTGTYRITGDASGHKHDTRSGSITDFHIIQQEMKIPTSWMNYQNKTNMSLGMSRDLINMAFHSQIIKINRKGCPNLINDIRIAKPKENGSEFIKDRNMYKLDVLDAFRYLFHDTIKDITEIHLKKSLYGIG